MSTAFTVKHGTSRLRVYCSGGRWRFQYREGGKWKSVSRVSKDDAKAEAQAALERQAAGLSLSSLSASDAAFLREVAELAGDQRARDAVLAVLRDRKPRPKLSEAADAYVAELRRLKGRERAVYGVEWQLRRFRLATGDKDVALVSVEDLRGWLERFKHPKTANGAHQAIAQFLRWCRKQDYLPQTATVAEKVARAKVPRKDIVVLSPADLALVLDHCPASLRPWVVLQAWCGLRPEEIRPGQSSRLEKEPLVGQDIDWTFKVVRVRAATSKVGRPRIVPLCPAALAGLAWAGVTPEVTGPLVLVAPHGHRMLPKLAAACGWERWPADALRHSYGSYRNAELRNLSQVAEEMGTSERQLHAHYHSPQPSELAAKWFDPTLIPETPCLPLKSSCGRR